MGLIAYLAAMKRIKQNYYNFVRDSAPKKASNTIISLVIFLFLDIVSIIDHPILLVQIIPITGLCWLSWWLRNRNGHNTGPLEGRGEPELFRITVESIQYILGYIATVFVIELSPVILTIHILKDFLPESVIKFFPKVVSLSVCFHICVFLRLVISIDYLYKILETTQKTRSQNLEIAPSVYAKFEHPETTI